MPAVGVIVNPHAGRDVRRLAARASSGSVDALRGEVARAVVGAAAAGAGRIVLARDPFRITERAAAGLRLAASVELLELPFTHGSEDSSRAAAALRAAGCTALVVFGGDGTSRAVARGWPGVPLVPLSGGTNNVFPLRIEATLAGAAAGLVCAKGVALEEVAAPAKVVRAEIEREPSDFALIDAAFLADDRVGNLLPFDPARLRRVVLARAEPAAIGISPVGGLLEPCAAGDEFGVDVVCLPHGVGGRTLRVPISAGLYGTVHVEGARRLGLGEAVTLAGPGVLAFDGDRERTLGPGQRARLRVLRDGPRVIDVERALRLAATRGLYLDLGPFRDEGSEAGGVGCC
jgi:hypothetical protein